MPDLKAHMQVIDNDKVSGLNNLSEVKEVWDSSEKTSSKKTLSKDYNGYKPKKTDN